jgi:hypothetical protein
MKLQAFNPTQYTPAPKATTQPQPPTPAKPEQRSGVLSLRAVIEREGRESAQYPLSIAAFKVYQKAVPEELYRYRKGVQYPLAVNELKVYEEEIDNVNTYHYPNNGALLQMIIPRADFQTTEEEYLQKALQSVHAVDYHCWEKNRKSSVIEELKLMAESIPWINKGLIIMGETVKGFQFTYRGERNFVKQEELGVLERLSKILNVKHEEKPLITVGTCEGTEKDPFPTTLITIRPEVVWHQKGRTDALNFIGQLIEKTLEG